MTEVYLGMPPVNIIKFIEEQQQKNDYMTIEALEDGVNVKIKRTKSAQTGNFQIKLNDSDWKDVSWEDIGNDKEYDLINVVSNKSSMSKGDKLQFRNIDKFSDNSNTYSQLIISKAKAKVYGKLAKSLTSEFAASSQEYKLACMFNSSTSLVDASELNLNDIIISTGCYYSMFEGCTSLTSAPELPATELASYCYDNMFFGCAKITELHYPASIENDSTFKNLDGSPNFGADNATVYYDL